MSASKKVIVKRVVLAYPSLFTPSLFEGDGDDKTPQFQTIGIMPSGHPGIGLLQAAIKEVATEEYGDSKGVKHFLRKNAEKSDQPGFDADEEGYFFNAKNKRRVPVVDRDGRTPIAESDDKVYAGCVANLVVQVWAQRKGHRYGKRVNCGLMGVQYVEAGERIGGGGIADEDDFEQLDEAPDEELASSSSDDWLD